MYYIYIIRSEKIKTEFYIGLTNSPIRRLKEHNLGKSFHTNKYKPWEIVYLEGYASKEDALDREIKLKQFGKVYSQLKRRIWRSLEY